MSLVTEFNPSRKSINPEFEEIYREYSELVCRTVKGILGTVEDAEDVEIVCTVSTWRCRNAEIHHTTLGWRTPCVLS
jgi:hypothetical protein